MKEAGNLEGILLTGLTKDGVDLMESYVDRTGDVQTASYCMLQVSVADGSLQEQFAHVVCVLSSAGREVQSGFALDLAFSLTLTS